MFANWAACPHAGRCMWLVYRNVSALRRPDGCCLPWMFFALPSTARNLILALEHSRPTTGGSKVSIKKTVEAGRRIKKKNTVTMHQQKNRKKRAKEERKEGRNEARKEEEGRKEGS